MFFTGFAFVATAYVTTGCGFGWFMSMSRKLGFLVSLCFFLNIINAVVGNIEVDALCDIKTINNPSSWETKNPCSDTLPCDTVLPGITCQLGGGEPLHIVLSVYTYFLPGTPKISRILSSNDLQGTIPASIGNLTHVKSLCAVLL